MKTKEWLGSQGVRTPGRRWYLDSYARTVESGSRWHIGWITYGDRARAGVEVCGPRRCTALYFMPDARGERDA